jgi:hypothetical protein
MGESADNGRMVVRTMEGFTDADFKRTMWSALRLLAVITVVAAPLIWWKMGWQSAVLLLVGALISGSGLYEWLRLMTAVMVRMDAGGKARPMGLVLFGFFLRLGLTVVLLYVSLKLLNGSVYALAAGLAMGVFALTVEGLRCQRNYCLPDC